MSKQWHTKENTEFLTIYKTLLDGKKVTLHKKEDYDKLCEWIKTEREIIGKAVEYELLTTYLPQIFLPKYLVLPDGRLSVWFHDMVVLLYERGLTCPCCMENQYKLCLIMLKNFQPAVFDISLMTKTFKNIYDILRFVLEKLDDFSYPEHEKEFFSIVQAYTQFIVLSTTLNNAKNTKQKEKIWEDWNTKNGSNDKRKELLNQTCNAFYNLMNYVDGMSDEELASIDELLHRFHFDYDSNSNNNTDKNRHQSEPEPVITDEEMKNLRNFIQAMKEMGKINFNDVSKLASDFMREMNYQESLSKKSNHSGKSKMSHSKYSSSKSHGEKSYGEKSKEKEPVDDEPLSLLGLYNSQYRGNPKKEAPVVAEEINPFDVE